MEEEIFDILDKTVSRLYNNIRGDKNLTDEERKRLYKIALDFSDVRSIMASFINYGEVKSPRLLKFIESLG